MVLETRERERGKSQDGENLENCLKIDRLSGSLPKHAFTTGFMPTHYSTSTWYLTTTSLTHHFRFIYLYEPHIITNVPASPFLPFRFSTFPFHHHPPKASVINITFYTSPNNVPSFRILFNSQQIVSFLSCKVFQLLHHVSCVPKEEATQKLSPPHLTHS